MNKFVTIFCLLLAISAIYSQDAGSSARMYDGLFPMNTVLATTATDNSVTAPATDFVFGAIGTMKPLYGVDGETLLNNNYMIADTAFNGGQPTELVKQFRVENVVTNSGKANSVAENTFDNARVETSDFGLLTNPGSQYSTVGGLAGADGTQASQGRLVIGAASATTFKQNNAMSTLDAGSANFLGLNDAFKLGAQASTSTNALAITTPIIVRVTPLDNNDAKDCLLGGANVASLMWCYTFTCDITTFTTTLSTGLVGDYSVSPPTGNTLPAANTALKAYLTTHFVTTANSYVMRAVISGLLTAFGLPEQMVTAAVNGSSSTTGMEGLKTTFSESVYNTGTADTVKLQADWLLAVSGRASWTDVTEDSNRTGATAPWSKVLQNKAYCTAFSSASEYIVPGTFWRSEQLQYTVNCNSPVTYSGMKQSEFDTTETPNTDNANTTLWTNGVCSSGMSAGDIDRVNNCCMNSEDMESFTNCMNFLSADFLNMTTYPYTTLLKNTFEATNDKASCLLLLNKGLNWLSAEQLQSWKATCDDDEARSLLSADLVSTFSDNVTSSTGDLLLATWETKFGRYYDTWAYTNNSWSEVRDSQLGGKACVNAFDDHVKCQIANHASQNTTGDANWSMLGSDALNALGTACAVSTIDAAKITRAENCCLNAKSNSGYDTCVRSAQGADTPTLDTTWENGSGNTGNKNILGLWSGATPVVDNWTGLKGLDSNDNMSQVWGWVEPTKFYSLKNLFNSGTMWYEYAVSTLFDFSDSTRTFDQYNNMLNHQPEGFASNWLGVANCKTQVALGTTCTQFNRYNSLFGESLFNAGEANSLLCPLATEDADHLDLLDLCCERCDATQGKECVLWAAKANVVNQIPNFKLSFENGFAAFETTSAPANLSGLEGESLTMHNCGMKFEEMPLNVSQRNQICGKYMENLTLFQEATDPAAEDSCALVTSANVASVDAFYTCMMEFEMDSDEEGSGSTGSGSTGSGASPENTDSDSDAGSVGSGSGSTADCSCYANLLKTFGTSLVMAILLNFLN